MASFTAWAGTTAVSALHTLFNAFGLAIQLRTVVAKTATFTVGSGDTSVRYEDVYRCDATAGAITANLPAATGTGRSVLVIKTDASGNAVTLDGSGAETINGVTTLTLAAQYNRARVVDAAAGVWLVEHQ